MSGSSKTHEVPIYARVIGVIFAYFAPLMIALGAEPPELDEEAVRDRVFSEAVSKSQLERRG
jgi:hypothetical protein